MKIIAPLAPNLVEKTKPIIVLPKLNPEQLFALVLGLPMMLASLISKEPLNACSLFIALMIMMFKQQLNPIRAQINSRIKLWQIFGAFILGAIFVSQAIYPANAFQTVQGSDLWQQQILATGGIGASHANQAAINAIKLAIVVTNLLLMAVLFLVAVFVRHCWAKFSNFTSNNLDRH